MKIYQGTEKSVHKNGSVKLAGWGEKTSDNWILQPMKNVGSAVLREQLNPGSPEGMVRYALISLKACWFCPGERKYKGGIIYENKSIWSNINGNVAHRHGISAKYDGQKR